MENRKYDCPKCRDTGFILFDDGTGHSYAQPCKCREIKEAKERLARSGLAKEFKAKTFENYRTGGKPQLEDAKRRIRQYTELFHEIKNNRFNSVILSGQVGAGKTHLGTACSVCLIEKGIPVVYMGYREEITNLKSKIMNEQAYSIAVNRFKNASVLFIDDFLKGRLTESDVNIVYEIVNYRYNNNLPFIISTEKTLGGLIDFDEAIGSRLIEMSRGRIIVFKGEELNYRLYGGDK